MQHPTLNKDSHVSSGPFIILKQHCYISCQANAYYLQLHQCGAENKGGLILLTSFLACIFACRQTCTVFEEKRIRVGEHRLFPVLSQIIRTYCISAEA